jgi:hypothetical protein
VSAGEAVRACESMGTVAAWTKGVVAMCGGLGRLVEARGRPSGGCGRATWC